ncbi:LamG-like jellyroll fold domain-containing protein [Actinoplanes sp. NPDC049681]|uniref:LamG-like jellyroll fold domain-containing protein n=1 Tax=Actinoplanes sp. NPDC049681 TaxID=3363905 RepID=UPI0037ADA9C5
MLATTVLGVTTPAMADPPPPAPQPTTPPVTPAQPSDQRPPQEEPDIPAPTNDPAEQITDAIAQAQKSGHTVPISSLTDEYSTTVASPDGTFATTYSVTPQQVQRDGKWTDVDTTLVHQADGSWAPKAAPADVRFGGGGDTTLVTLKHGANALKFSWTAKLPAPAITGDTATYPNVLPDVDLQVTANATGYSSIFVVKTAAAAASSEVQQLDLGLVGTKVKVSTTRDGGAEATDTTSGRTVFQANTAMMWDSTPSTDGPAERVIRTKALSSPQAAHEAASLLGRHRTRVKVGFRKGRQSLTLDKTLLTAKSTKFPVFVDPDWGVKYYGAQSAWARISSNGWNVYNSTSTTGANSARIGLDDWPQYGGAGEKARTYYKMNISGIKGATVKQAYFYVKHRWSASCYKTSAELYATGAPAGFSSSTLHWGKEPSRGSLLDTESGQELNCGKSSPSASPGTFTFNVTGNVASLVKNKKGSAYFLIEAKDMNDKMSWKQLGYKGGASLTVHYSYPPRTNPDDGKQHVFPSISDGGKVITTSRTPTLSWRATNRFPNGVQRPLMVDYHVEQKGTGKLIAYGYGPGQNKYNTNGSDWGVNVELPDGDYQWKVTAKNADGLWAPAWSGYKYFTVDATAPNPPSIKSTQFPPGQVGAKYSDKGVFALSNDRKNNVTGYLFCLDGDLNGVVYANNKGTQWVAGTTIKPGTVYYAKADNKDGTGTVVTNGSAGLTFAPGRAGLHKVMAKAVDQAGSTSGQTTYQFNAGTSTPLYVYGDKMISGYTQNNTDGTTTAVPKATTTSTGGVLVAQPNYAGYYFLDGYQAMLGNNAATGTKVAAGDSATFSFAVPQLGIWEIGANLTVASDYGTYSLTLDQGRSTQSAVLPSFDAYATPNGTKYRNLIVRDVNNAPIVLDQGVHTITLKLTGKNASSGGFQAGIDGLRLSQAVTCPINDTRACLNNKAISTWQPGATPPVTDADADGWGFSLNAGNLTDAGWTPGAALNVHGASVKLPATWGDGHNDNILADGQLITVPSGGVTNKGNAVVFVGFAVNGDVKDASGRITYAKDSGCNVTSQAYTIDWMMDWAAAPNGNAVLTLPWRNKTADGTAYSGKSPSIMAASVPLLCPGAAISSISLPLVSGTVEDHVNALHILGVGVRPTSSTADGARWVGSWSAAQDTKAVRTSASADATLSGQTVRIPAHLSIGAEPGRVRVRLANSRGAMPVTFDAASVALQDSSAAGATAAAKPVPLTFNGARNITLPAGTDVLSDPVDLPAADQSTVLVSLKVKGSLAALAGHRDAKTPVYISADTSDHTRDTDGATFDTSAMTGLPFLAGIDVSTPKDDPAGAVVLYGDQTVNSDTTAGDGASHLSDYLATALSTDEFGNRYPIRAGVLSQGSSSWSNASQLPPAADTPYPQNAYGLVDREILNQSNARIVLIASGTNDLLTCTDTAAACSDAVDSKLNALAGQLQQYRSDDALNYAVTLPTTSRTLKVYVATLPPFTGAHTAAQETARQLVNAHILGAGGPSTMEGYADGVIDFAAAVSADGTATGATVKPEDLDTSSDGKAYPNNLYYQSLAQQYVTDADSVDATAGDGTVSGGDDSVPLGEWSFKEGTGNVAADTGSGTGDPTQPVHHDAKLSNVTWASPGRLADSKAGTFNGTSSYADTGLPFNTGQSFTVEAWVRLTAKSAKRTILARTGSDKASLYLQYDAESDCWLAQMPSATSGDSVATFDAICNEGVKAQLNTWTHVAAVYDASVNGLQLYVNGKPQGYADEVTPFNEPDKTAWIGRSGTAWFAGDIADVRVWQRAMGDAEVEAEAAPRKPMVIWQFEDQSQPTTATDSSLVEPEASGTFTGGVAWKTEGHPHPDGDTSGTDSDLGAITLNGTTGAVTTRARVRTDQSFTVAGWARITDTTRDQAVLSQYGTHTSGYRVGYGSTCKCWRFVLPTTDTANAAAVTVESTAAVTAGTWVHLAGVYDATAGTATIYVNGTAAPAITVPTRTWNAAKQFTVGRGLRQDASGEYFAGDVDDVYAYQEALDSEEINNLRRTGAPQG